MESKPGTYVLVLRSHSRVSTQIGSWGCLDIEPGYYIYVGSAFGPGGVQARVSRHCRSTKSKHWHIDYLREFVVPFCAWYSHEPVFLEHRWARTIPAMIDTSPVKGFGCSDCKCHAHLFYMTTKPKFYQFSSAVGGPVESWIYQADC